MKSGAGGVPVCVGKGGTVANANTSINTEDSDEIRSRRNAGVFGEGGTVDEEEDLLYRGRPQVGPGNLPGCYADDDNQDWFCYVALFYLDIFHLVIIMMIIDHVSLNSLSFPLNTG